MNNVIVKLPLACPITHYISVANIIMQYCEIHVFVSLQILVQGLERRGRQRCQQPIPAASAGHSHTLRSRAAALQQLGLASMARPLLALARRRLSPLAPVALAAAGTSIGNCSPA
jgi:hypothetical protein